MTDQPSSSSVASEAIAFTIELQLEQLAQLAERVAQLLEQTRDDGFLDTDGAATYLSLSKSAVYHLVERGKLPHQRASGRLLFDRRQLRRWVEAQP
jgi:excisionase family DNA binding protein